MRREFEMSLFGEIKFFVGLVGNLIEKLIIEYQRDTQKVWYGGL